MVLVKDGHFVCFQVGSGISNTVSTVLICPIFHTLMRSMLMKYILNTEVHHVGYLYIMDNVH